MLWVFVPPVVLWVIGAVFYAHFLPAIGRWKRLGDLLIFEAFGWKVHSLDLQEVECIHIGHSVFKDPGHLLDLYWTKKLRAYGCFAFDYRGSRFYFITRKRIIMIPATVAVLLPDLMSPYPRVGN